MEIYHKVINSKVSEHVISVPMSETGFVDSPGIDVSKSVEGMVILQAY